MSDELALKRARTTFERALKQMAAGDYKKAMDALRTAETETGPAVSADARALLAEIRFALGDSLERNGDPEGAARAYEAAVDFDPRHKRAVTKHVEYAFDKTTDNDALPTRHYIDYVAFGRDKVFRSRVLKRLQGLLRIRLTDRVDTLNWRIEQLEELFRQAPEINFPKLYLGRGNYLLGRWRKAIDHLADISGTAQETHDLLNMLGRSHEKLGELAEASAAYEKSLRQQQHQPGIRFRLGRLRLKAAEIDPQRGG